jgi:hypothetical protein
MIDLLEMLHKGEISPEKAYCLQDELLEKVDRGEVDPHWWPALGLSNHEVTALAYGADFEDLVKLRYEGWPTICPYCHLPLDYRLYKWLFSLSDDGSPQLEHLVCPSKDLDGKRTLMFEPWVSLDQNLGQLGSEGRIIVRDEGLPKIGRVTVELKPLPEFRLDCYCVIAKVHGTLVHTAFFSNQNDAIEGADMAKLLVQVLRSDQ